MGVKSGDQSRYSALFHCTINFPPKKTTIEKITLANVLIRRSTTMLKEKNSSQNVGGWYSYSVLFQSWSLSGTCYIYGLVSPLEKWLHHTDHWSINCLVFCHVWFLAAVTVPFSLQVPSTDQRMSSGEYSLSSYMGVSHSKNSIWQSGSHSFITCSSLGTYSFHLLCCKMQWTLVVRSPIPWEHCRADYCGGCV